MFQSFGKMPMLQEKQSTASIDIFLSISILAVNEFQSKGKFLPVLRNPLEWSFTVVTILIWYEMIWYDMMIELSSKPCLKRAHIKRAILHNGKSVNQKKSGSKNVF